MLQHKSASLQPGRPSISQNTADSSISHINDDQVGVLCPCTTADRLSLYQLNNASHSALGRSEILTYESLSGAG